MEFNVEELTKKATPYVWKTLSSPNVKELKPQELEDLVEGKLKIQQILPWYNIFCEILKRFVKDMKVFEVMAKQNPKIIHWMHELMKHDAAFGANFFAIMVMGAFDKNMENKEIFKRKGHMLEQYNALVGHEKQFLPHEIDDEFFRKIQIGKLLVSDSYSIVPREIVESSANKSGDIG